MKDTGTLETQFRRTRRVTTSAARATQRIGSKHFFQQQYQNISSFHTRGTSFLPPLRVRAAQVEAFVTSHHLVRKASRCLRARDVQPPARNGSRQPRFVCVVTNHRVGSNVLGVYLPSVDLLAPWLILPLTAVTASDRKVLTTIAERSPASVA